MSAAMIKMMLLGVFTFAFATAPAYAKAAADDDEREAETPRKQKRVRKSKRKVDMPRMVVAIDKFENKSGVSAPELGTVRDRLRACMAGSRKFEAVEYEQIRAALSEQALAARGVTDGENVDVSMAGKMKSACYIVYGSVLSCHVRRMTSTSEGASMTLNRYSVELDIKLGNTETGRILTQKCVTGTGVDRDVSSADSPSGQGLRDAIDEACRLAVAALRDAVFPAKVVKVGKTDITINMTEAEVLVGDVFDLIETDSPRSISGEKIGRVKITDTDPEVSKARPVKDAEGRIVALDEIDLEENIYIVRRVGRAQLMSERQR